MRELHPFSTIRSYRRTWHRAQGSGGGRDYPPGPPMVEFVLGNGHHDDAVEPQQSLFSWAEFMAEPVKPKRRNGKRDGRRGTLGRAQERVGHR